MVDKIDLIIAPAAETLRTLFLNLLSPVSIQTQALAFLAVFVYATHATQAIAFEWKPGFRAIANYVPKCMSRLSGVFHIIIPHPDCVN